MQTNPFGQIVSVLGRQGNQAAARTQRFNPRPAGILRPGGVPLAVLAFLEKNPDLWFSFYQIELATNRSQKALDWACRELRDLGLVATRENPANCRYFQYRFLSSEGQQL